MGWGGVGWGGVGWGGVGWGGVGWGGVGWGGFLQMEVTDQPLRMELGTPGDLHKCGEE